MFIFAGGPLVEATHDFGGGFDGAAALIAAAAGIALFRFRVGVVPLLAVCGALGLAVILLR